MIIKQLKYDIIGDWLINLYCNFSCIYCFQAIHKWHKKDLIGHKNIEDIITFFNNSRLKWLIHMSGGEPFLHPRYVELCRLLSKRHYISLNSNLSLNTLKDFVNNINPTRVAFINGSLHFEERNKRKANESYIRNFHLLKRAGFNIFATQVFFPLIIKDFEKIFNYYKDKGIVIRPKVFRGFYNSKQYPYYYTVEEKELFIKFSTLSQSLDKVNMYQIDPNLDRQFLDGDLNFQGIHCDAGRKFVWIKYNGDIVRCHAATIIMGNIFEGKFNLSEEANVCPFTVCLCPYYGLMFAKDKPKFQKPSYLSHFKNRIRNIRNEYYS